MSSPSGPHSIFRQPGSHDETRSCGSQPAYKSLTTRRAPAGPAAPLTDTMPASAAGIRWLTLDKPASIRVSPPGRRRNPARRDPVGTPRSGLSPTGARNAPAFRSTTAVLRAPTWLSQGTTDVSPMSRNCRCLRDSTAGELSRAWHEVGGVADDRVARDGVLGGGFGCAGDLECWQGLEELPGGERGSV